jgi:hypothetical protein
MSGNVLHGREGILYLSTSTGYSTPGTEVGYVNEFTVNTERDMTEISKINASAKEYVEGLVSGTLSASGSLRLGDSGGVGVLMKRFYKTLYTTDSTASTDLDGDANSIAEGNLYFHGILSAIDTAATSDNVKGSKVFAAMLSNGFDLEVSGGDLEGWTYNGTLNGDVYYIESTDTAHGIPKKA